MHLQLGFVAVPTIWSGMVTYRYCVCGMFSQQYLLATMSVWCLPKKIATSAMKLEIIIMGWSQSVQVWCVLTLITPNKRDRTSTTYSVVHSTIPLLFICFQLAAPHGNDCRRDWRLTDRTLSLASSTPTVGNGICSNLRGTSFLK